MPKIFMAAPVPRFLRQTRLGYLPLSAIVGSSMTQSDGNNIIFDVIMLPVDQFQRMKSNVGLQHIPTPGPKIGPGLNPGFVLNNARQVAVPDGEPDAEAYARAFFRKTFAIETVETETAPPTLLSSFATATKNIFGRFARLRIS